MSHEYQGSCLCGAVTYKVKGPFIRFFFCHCSRCRKASGSAHSANIFTRASNVTFLTGENNIQRFDLPDAENFSRCFCKTCGSNLPVKSRDGKLHVVPAGSIPQFSERKVDANAFWDSRADWYDGGIAAAHLTEEDIKKR